MTCVLEDAAVPRGALPVPGDAVPGTAVPGNAPTRRALLAAGHDVETNDADEPRSPEALRAAAADADAIVCLLTDRIDADVLTAGATA